MTLAQYLTSLKEVIDMLKELNTALVEGLEADTYPRELIKQLTDDIEEWLLTTHGRTVSFV